MQQCALAYICIMVVQHAYVNSCSNRKLTRWPTSKFYGCQAFVLLRQNSELLPFKNLEGIKLFKKKSPFLFLDLYPHNKCIETITVNKLN